MYALRGRAKEGLRAKMLQLNSLDHVLHISLHLKKINSSIKSLL